MNIRKIEIIVLYVNIVKKEIIKGNYSLKIQNYNYEAKILVIEIIDVLHCIEAIQNNKQRLINIYVDYEEDIYNSGTLEKGSKML